MLFAYLILVFSIIIFCVLIIAQFILFFLPVFWNKYSMYVYLFCSRFSRLGRAHFKTCHRFSMRSDFDLTIAIHLDVHLFCFWDTPVFFLFYFFNVWDQLLCKFQFCSQIKQALLQYFTTFCIIHSSFLRRKSSP